MMKTVTLLHPQVPVYLQKAQSITTTIWQHLLAPAYSKNSLRLVEQLRHRWVQFQKRHQYQRRVVGQAQAIRYSLFFFT